MTCPERDPDLLLLAHGALPWTHKFRAQIHLSLCRDCRTRFAQLTHVSALLASEVRDPKMPPWSPSQAVGRTSRLPSHWPMALALIALIVVLGLGAFISHRLTSSSPAGADRITAPMSGGCRPDLPNSRCR